MMFEREMLEVLETELECVNRQDTPTCDRNCEDCDLALPSEKVRGTYEELINMLKNNMMEEEEYEEEMNAWNLEHSGECGEM